MQYFFCQLEFHFKHRPNKNGTVRFITDKDGNNLLSYSRKKPNRGGLRTYFFESPLEFFIFLLYPLEIPDKAKLYPWKSHKIVLDPSEISRPETKTPGNSTLFFLLHHWKFHFIFNQPLEIPHAISLIPLEILYPQTPACLFFWTSSFKFIKLVIFKHVMF